MGNATLRQKDRQVLNFTQRIDISRDKVLFEATEDGGDIRFRIVLREWASLVGSIPGHCDVLVMFKRTGAAAWDFRAGLAHDVLRRGGEIVGITAGGFNPELLGAEVIISDPKDRSRIVLFSKLRKPDAVGVDIDLEDRPEPPEPVNPFRRAKGEVMSIVDIVETEDVAGYWEVDLAGDCVRLLVSKSLSKDAVVSDPFAQRAVLPATFGIVLTAMVFQAERYRDTEWYDTWKAFAAETAGVTWNDLFDGSLTDEELDDSIRSAVTAFARQYLPETGMPERTATTNGWEQ